MNEFIVLLFFLQVIFLERRENSLSTATLITTGSDGSVRAWSVCGGGLLGYFSASQGVHDSVISMTTNYANTILVTGDTAGFVKVMTSASLLNEVQKKRFYYILVTFSWKRSYFGCQVWDISCFCINASDQKIATALPRTRLSMNRRNSHRKGSIDTRPPPLVLTFRGHLKPIVSLEFVDSRQFIITASTDASVRLWTQTGRYIGNKTYALAQKTER